MTAAFVFAAFAAVFVPAVTCGHDSEGHRRSFGATYRAFGRMVTGR